MSRVYARDIRLAHVDEWQTAKDDEGRRLRDAAYADSESDENISLAKLAKRYRHERETSSDEEDIPLMELRKILRNRELRQNQETEEKDMECNDELSSDNSCSLPFVDHNNPEGDMDVSEVHLQPSSSRMRSVKSVEEERHQEPRSQKKGDVKQLLRLISNML